MRGRKHCLHPCPCRKDTKADPDDPDGRAGRQPGEVTSVKGVELDQSQVKHHCLSLLLHWQVFQTLTEANHGNSSILLWCTVSMVR